MIDSMIIQPPAGVNYVYSPSFAFVTPILVTMEGEQIDISLSATGNRKCMYAAGEGRFYFQNAFDGIKKVNLKYKIINSGT